jgi:hypothetical protein
MARKPANELDLSLVDLGRHIDKTKQNKEATSSKNQDLLAPKPFTVLAVSPKSDLFWTAVVLVIVLVTALLRHKTEPFAVFLVSSTSNFERRTSNISSALSYFSSSILAKI